MAPRLVAIYTGSYMEAQIMKSHLESEGIPAILTYEPAGLVYGVTVDGLGETTVLVPEQLSKEAKEILNVQEVSPSNDV